VEDLDYLKNLLIRMNRQLDWNVQTTRKYDLYYEGRNVLANIPDSVRAEVPNLPEIRIPFGRLVIDALSDRLDLAGFKVPDDRTSAELWEVFQRSDGDEISEAAHLEALTTGRSFLQVWSDVKTGYPKITVESARHCHVFVMPGMSHRIAGIKRWVDGEGQPYATLFTPNSISRWKSPNKIALDPYLNPMSIGNPALTFDSYALYDFSQLPSVGWELREAPRPNPLKLVPIIPLINRPRLLNPLGESELATLTPLLDSIDAMAQDMLITSAYSAMPRRWAVGLDIQTRVNPDTGKEEVIDPFSTQKGRVWLAENEATQFGQFPEASLSNYADAIRSMVTHLGALSGLPAHYLGIAPPETSADMIRSSEAPLVRRAQRKQKVFGNAWEEAMRLCDVIMHGYRRPQLELLSAVWSDAETRTIAQAADAATKLSQIGVPLRQLAEDLNYSPTEIAKMPDKAPTPVAVVPNGAGPPDAPETDREIRGDNEQIGRAHV